MANFSKYFDKLLLAEGGYNEVPGDNGGATNFGVSLKVWVENGYDKDKDGDIDKYDLKLITKEDAESIAKKLYWDKIKGDYITSQSVAEIIFDFAYNSGVPKASKSIQKILGLPQDGIIGNNTLYNINKQNPKDFFDEIKNYRINYYKSIVKNNPSQKKFLKGWLNRINNLTFAQ